MRFFLCSPDQELSRRLYTLRLLCVRGFPTLSVFLLNFLRRALYRMSFTSELFPEPDTPVTHVRVPRGNRMFMFLRLFSLAPITFIELPLVFLREPGTSIFFFVCEVFLRGRVFRRTQETPEGSLIHDLSPAVSPPGDRAPLCSRRTLRCQDRAL